ncbi:unnamed protein product [Gordionus sp. m RMFG-2023]
MTCPFVVHKKYILIILSFLLIYALYLLRHFDQKYWINYINVNFKNNSINSGKLFKHDDEYSEYVNLLPTTSRFSFESKNIDIICEPDYIKNNGKPICRPRCPKGYFYLNEMIACHPWLSCSDIRSDVRLGPKIGNGNIKKVYIARWKNIVLVVNRGNPSFFKSYFNPGIKSLMAMQPSPHITQYIGHCRNFLLTEFHPLGDLGKLNIILSQSLSHLDTLLTRFQICLDYATILSFLTDPEKMSGGVRIMCDTSSLKKLLGQYLLTNSLRIILNDVESLPFINYAKGHNTTKCGKKPKVGLFSAPEQRWPIGLSYKKSRQILYDEKADIWKLPDVCNYILGNNYLHLPFSIIPYFNHHPPK